MAHDHNNPRELNVKVIVRKVKVAYRSCAVLFRYQKGKIYTYIGEVVVSVNPYRTMNIYGNDYVDSYKGREIYERPPHIFAVADAAYRAMKRRARDTCIVISGTSAYSKRVVSRTNCSLRIKKCAPRISSGSYFLSTS